MLLAASWCTQLFECYFIRNLSYLKLGHPRNASNKSEVQSRKGSKTESTHDTCAFQDYVLGCLEAFCRFLVRFLKGGHDSAKMPPRSIQGSFHVASFSHLDFAPSPEVEAQSPHPSLGNKIAAGPSPHAARAPWVMPRLWGNKLLHIKSSWHR